MEELLSLKWNNHRSTFLHILTILRDKQLYTDATLACEGRFYSVHRLVLSTCSDYFSAIFDRTTCKNPTVVLKDIKCEDLEALLDYMYLGEVNVRQTELASLIKAAECLRVKGLAVPDDEPPRKGGRSDSSKVRNSDVHSPPHKRKRREVSEDHRDDLRQSSSTPKTTQSHARLSPIPQETIAESGQTSSNPNQSTDSSLTNNIPLENQTFVKMEMEDSGGGDDIGGTFNVSNDGYKEEEGDDLEDPGGDLSNDLPEFLQQAAGSHHSGSSFSHGSFAGTSSFQPGDMGWQGEGSNLNFPGQLNFSPTDSSSQNAPGKDQKTDSRNTKIRTTSFKDVKIEEEEEDPLDPLSEYGDSNGSSASVSVYKTGVSSSCRGDHPTSLFVASSSKNYPEDQNINADDNDQPEIKRCPHCKKVFPFASKLKEHMLTHSREKPHGCPYCPFRCVRKRYLVRHIQTKKCQLMNVTRQRF